MTINCHGNLMDLSKPMVMGVLNLTPDSFYDGGTLKDENDALKRVELMLSEGAAIIDIGAYSSRPGADFVPEDEELKRLESILKNCIRHFPEAIISIDTFRAWVAERCIEMGTAMINDISGGDLDATMMKTIAKHQVPYIMMHMRGNAQTMQQQTDYEDVIKEVLKSLSQKVSKARHHKINDLILDPGFGFAKTLPQNYELLSKLELFQNFKLPVLVGISRKSMIYKLLKTSPEKALNGTSVLNTIAVLKGANILRVHDVKEAVECITLINQLNHETATELLT